MIKAKNKKTAKKLIHYYFPTIHTVIDEMRPNTFFDDTNANVNGMNTVF